jgi:hypothetical protein
MKFNGWQRLGIAASMTWGLLLLTVILTQGRPPLGIDWLILAAPIAILWTLGSMGAWIRSGFRGERDAGEPIRGKNWWIGAALLAAGIAYAHTPPPAQPVDPYAGFSSPVSGQPPRPAPRSPVLPSRNQTERGFS